MKELLRLLENNARYKCKDLAVLLNEEEEQVREQMNRCVEEGIIRGYHTIINWEKADQEICEALIFVSCRPDDDAGYDRIAEKISYFPEVESLYLISGKAEFMLRVKGANMREVSSFIAHKLAPLKGVRGTETMFILKDYKMSGFVLNDDKNEERLMVAP